MVYELDKIPFVIHPGETLKETLHESKMSIKELAAITGFEENYIEGVVNGLESISPAFAKSLEQVFKVDARFWMNLQRNYDNDARNS